MKTWKVYANCCTVSNPIQEVGEDEIRETIEEIVVYRIHNGELEFNVNNQDEVLSNAYNTLKDRFNDTGIIECGDYMIITSEEKPKRPNVCGWSEL